jgi:hypothetical protein
MFFVLQTKLQKTHSNPGRTEAGCRGAKGRGIGGQEWVEFSLPPTRCTSQRHTLSGTASLYSKELKIASESMSPSHPSTPYLGANQVKRKCTFLVVHIPLYPGPNICFSTWFLSRYFLKTESLESGQG